MARVHEGHVAIGQGREGDVVLARLDADAEVVGRIAEDDLAEVFAVAHALGLHEILNHILRRRGVATEEGGRLAVHVVGPRTTGVVFNLVETRLEGHLITDAEEVVALGREGRFEVDGTIIIDGINHRVGAERAFGSDGDGHLRIVGRGRDADGLVANAIGGIARAAVVLHPAIVGIFGARDEEELLAHLPRGQVALAVKADGHLAVLERIVGSRLREGNLLRALRIHGRQGNGARLDGILCGCHRIASIGPRRAVLQADLKVDESLLARLRFVSKGQVDALRLARCDAGQSNAALFDDAALFEDGVLEVEGREVEEVVGVAQGHLLVGCAERRELDVLINALHLREFGRPSAVSGNQTIVDEVALVGTGIVRACAILEIAVLGERAVLDILCGVDGLVHEVPDATADAVGASFDVVPIFLEIADGIAHGVSIFADEIGLAAVVIGGSGLDFSHRGVHFRAEVRGCCSSAGGSFVMDDARVECAHCIVGCIEILATTGLVA